MTRRPVQALGLFAMLALAACGGSATTTAPSAAASPIATEGSAAAGLCTSTTEAGTVAVSIKDFEFVPATISARVGDVITFTNDGAKPHSAALDGGDCATQILASGGSEGLTFSTAGTYAFHCAVHAAMTGTITINE